MQNMLPRDVSRDIRNEIRSRRYENVKNQNCVCMINSVNHYLLCIIREIREIFMMENFLRGDFFPVYLNWEKKYP